MRFEGFSTENKRISKCIPTTADTVITDLLKSQSERSSALGLGLNSDGIIPVYFCGLIGSPAEENMSGYKNALFTLREDLIRSPKFLIFIPGAMSAPTAEETLYFDAVTRGNTDEAVEDLAKLINIGNDGQRTDEARRLFKENAQKYAPAGFEAVFAYGVRTVTWLNRCTALEQFAKSAANEIPAVIFYGSAGEKETEFLHFLSRVGFDVLVVSTSKASLETLKSNNTESRMQIFEFAADGEEFPFPDKLIKSARATIAYSAEQELNSFMYSNTSIFRDFQFSDMQSLTLKTTYEEIDILWHQAAKYRTGFDVIKNKTVVIPNIFAKISGVRDGDLDEYWDDVRQKLSPLTRIIMKAPSYDKFPPSVYTAYRAFYDGKNIDIEKLKNSPVNSYRFLSDELQMLIFHKMQEAVDSGLLLLEEHELVPLVIYVGLALDREILRILQKFDFTKDIPKIVLIDAIEDTFSKVECIQLLLFNLLGFDIIVYTPTGYKNLETYISPEAFTTFGMNEFKYNIRIPRFKIPDTIPEPKENGGLFNKLFKKGRK
ncbi:MAG: YceG family protein [Oscillospiraceae bacterium]